MNAPRHVDILRRWIQHELDAAETYRCAARRLGQRGDIEHIAEIVRDHERLAGELCAALRRGAREKPHSVTRERVRICRLSRDAEILAALGASVSERIQAYRAALDRADLGPGFGRLLQHRLATESRHLAWIYARLERAGHPRRPESWPAATGGAGRPSDGPRAA